jgi:ABC-type sugar transport system ATPase subunit
VVLSADGVVVEPLALSNALQLALGKGSSLTLGVRPEHLSVAAGGGGNAIAGKLFANENMGPESLVTMERADASRVTARIFTDEHVEVGESVRFGFSTEHVTLFDGEGKRIPRDGENPL